MSAHVGTCIDMVEHKFTKVSCNSVHKLIVYKVGIIEFTIVSLH